MDNKEQQDQELEALESIFPQEFKLIQKDPVGVFTFDLKSKDYDYDPEEGARVLINFTYTSNYPDELPQFEIEEIENFGDVEDIVDFVNTNATENLGMPMVYTLVFALMEKLDIDNENRKNREAEEKERKERERELEEQRRFEGTKVNVDSFLKWKLKFDQEMKELKHVVEVTNKKLTGKQLFERSDALVDSDLAFGEGEDNIEVDESLFLTMDGLDIDATGIDDDDDDDDEEEE